MKRTKPLNDADLSNPIFEVINDRFNDIFGPRWPQVPLRRWEYVAAIAFSNILSAKRDVVILEAGAGVSVFTPFLAMAGFNVHCFDTGHMPARTQRDIDRGVSDRVTEYDMDMRDILFLENTFDYVFCISAIEHVNAGRFATEPGDHGDEKAMAELARVLKPGGTMFLTTDYAERYYPPPGLWDTGSHRIYDEARIRSLVQEAGLQFSGGTEFDMDWSTLKKIEPKGYAYTTFAITVIK